ncbi:MAG: glycosyltransferase family 2 protein [Nitrososphaerota archaeon]|nr:glycosyltransferase family 2 protein [Candidatus Bathyarchaeota archaeon]MDW8023960.1 glycosyltransferase family 2 protein [Nitrososphaerota archaeon]
MKKCEENGEKVEVSMVLPAYNEAGMLEEAVKQTNQALKEIASSYEIIIAEDGSTDGTDKIALGLSLRYPNVKHIHSDKRLGRGLALKNAFNNSRGEILAFMDVDLSTNLKHLKTLIETIREGYDVAVGSRMLPQSKAERKLSRKIASKIYNFMVRTLLGSEIRDHQCGFKAFKREAILKILKVTEATHWFWDTEILVRASRMGYKIKEIPVEWRSGEKTKVHLLKDSIRMGRQLLKFWWNLKRQPFSKKRTQSDT